MQEVLLSYIMIYDAQVLYMELISGPAFPVLEVKIPFKITRLFKNRINIRSSGERWQLIRHVLTHEHDLYNFKLTIYSKLSIPKIYSSLDGKFLFLMGPEIALEKVISFFQLK